MNRSEQVSYRGLMAAAIIFIILLCDQILKFWVKTNFYLGEDVQILSWFHLKFIENNGMAFGMELSSKLLLTFGRIAAVLFFIWVIVKLKDSANLRTGFIVCLSLITAGAAGNIVDCIFYGQIFNSPAPPDFAQFLPQTGGYAEWFEGRVVDMFYFPIFSFYWPDWMPFVGSEKFEFFQYIFNVADSAICVGVLMLLFFFSADVNNAIAILKQKRE